MIDLSNLERPNTVSIFGKTKAEIKAAISGGPDVSGARISALILQNLPIPIPTRVRFDLTKNISIQSPVTASASTIEPSVVTKLKRELRTITMAVTLSANPIGAVATPFGFRGATFRRDLTELKKLRDLQASDEPLTVVLPNGDVLKSCGISISEVHEGLNKVELNLTIREFRIVSPQSITTQASTDEVTAGATSTENIGQQPTSTVTLPDGVGNG